MKKIIFVLSMVIALSAFAGDLQAQTTVKRKVNSSHKGKSTAIGAVAGAVTGAAVSKDKSKGAIIGGAAGAGAGYIYGSHRNKKHPKVVTKTKVVKQ